MSPGCLRMRERAPIFFFVFFFSVFVFSSCAAPLLYPNESKCGKESETTRRGEREHYRLTSTQSTAEKNHALVILDVTAAACVRVRGWHLNPDPSVCNASDCWKTRFLRWWPAAPYAYTYIAVQVSGPGRFSPLSRWSAAVHTPAPLPCQLFSPHAGAGR